MSATTRVLHVCPSCGAQALLYVADATVSHLCPARPIGKRLTTFRVERDLAVPTSTDLSRQDKARAKHEQRRRQRRQEQNR